jgi:hypothetical protein
MSPSSLSASGTQLSGGSGFVTNVTDEGILVAQANPDDPTRLEFDAVNGVISVYNSAGNLAASLDQFSFRAYRNQIERARLAGLTGLTVLDADGNIRVEVTDTGITVNDSTQTTVAHIDIDSGNIQIQQRGIPQWHDSSDSGLVMERGSITVPVLAGNVSGNATQNFKTAFSAAPEVQLTIEGGTGSKLMTVLANPVPTATQVSATAGRADGTAVTANINITVKYLAVGTP